MEQNLNEDQNKKEYTTTQVKERLWFFVFILRNILFSSKCQGGGLRSPSWKLKNCFELYVIHEFESTLNQWILCTSEYYDIWATSAGISS